jgi:hypothetical protein
MPGRSLPKRRRPPLGVQQFHRRPRAGDVTSMGTVASLGTKEVCDVLLWEGR